MQRRPLVNTRDEPHANNELYRRFHVIIGDSNLSLYSIYLKIGTTCLVLQALLNRPPLERVPKVSDPLQTLKTISRYDVEIAGGERAADERGRNPARLFATGEGVLPHLDSDWKNVMDAWEQVLDDLDVDPLSTADRLDWSAKYRLIEEFRQAEKLEVNDPWLRSLDLAYHLWTGNGVVLRVDGTRGVQVAVLV